MVTEEELTLLGFGSESPDPVAAQQATTPGSAHSFLEAQPVGCAAFGWDSILIVAGVFWICAGNSVGSPGMVW